MNPLALALALALALVAPTATAAAEVGCTEKVWIVGDERSGGVYVYAPCGSTQKEVCLADDRDDLCAGIRQAQ